MRGFFVLHRFGALKVHAKKQTSFRSKTMATDQQKGRPELAPSEAAQQTTFNRSIFHTTPHQIKSPSLKRLRTVQAEFALRGYELLRSVRAHDGRTSYVASRCGDARHYTHWQDVEGFLASLGGRS